MSNEVIQAITVRVFEYLTRETEGVPERGAVTISVAFSVLLTLFQRAHNGDIRASLRAIYRILGEVSEGHETRHVGPDGELVPVRSEPMTELRSASILAENLCNVVFAHKSFPADPGARWSVLVGALAALVAQLAENDGADLEVIIGMFSASARGSLVKGRGGMVS